MEFFDRKQEVVDIQLTPHGKYLLSKGKWRPKFYAFFDRDVVYDVKYSGYTENQKDASDRIKSATRPKSQAITYGIESQFTRITQEYSVSEQQGTWTPPADLTFDSVSPPPPNLNLKDLNAPLGNSNLNSSYYPSFAANFFAGNISSSFDNYTGSLGRRGEDIPQINCKVNFTTKVKSGGAVFSSNEIPATEMSPAEIIEPGLSDEPDEDRIYSPEVYKDGTYVSIQTRQLLFDIIEKHIPLEKEDFDLEVFKVNTFSKNDGGTSYEYEDLKKLKFIRDDLGDEMVNYGNLIYNRQTKETFNIDPYYVEYYFDLRTDNEIEMPINVPANIIEQPPNPEEPCADE